MACYGLHSLMVKAGYGLLRITFSYGEGRIWLVKVYIFLW